MMTAVSFTDGLQSLTANLGTARDKAASTTYAVDEYSEIDLTNAYRSSWLAKKIVEIPALDSTREWRAWQGQPEQIEALEAEERRLGLQVKLLRARTLARLYGRAYLYFDLGDDPEKPPQSTIKKGAIRFLTVLTHHQLTADLLDQDPLSPTFGRPVYYTVVGGNRNARVHPSRVVELIGNARPEADVTNNLPPDSVLTALLQAVKQFDGTAANVASLVFEAKIDVIKVKGLMGIAGDPLQEAKLLQRYALAAAAKSNNGMLLLDYDSEEYDQKSFTFAALADLMDRFAQNSSGAADIPMTRLFGRSAAGMNSTGEGDLRNYYDRVGADQSLVLQPALADFDEVLIQSALGTRPPEIHYVWNTLWKQTDTERSSLGTAAAAMVKSLKDTGLIPDEVLASSAVALLTQDGALPGLEGAYEDYFEAAGKDKEEFYAEPEPEDDPTSGGGGNGNGTPRKLVDSPNQPRAPKGSPNGGQWVKGGASGDGSAEQVALSATATKKYGPDEVMKVVLKSKTDKGSLTHYEKKVLAKYKQNLAAAEQQQSTKTQGKPEVPDMVGYLSQGMVPGPDGKLVPESIYPAKLTLTSSKFGSKTPEEAGALIEDLYGVKSSNYTGPNVNFQAMGEIEVEAGAAYAYATGDTKLLTKLYETDPFSTMEGVPSSANKVSLGMNLAAASSAGQEALANAQYEAAMNPKPQLNLAKAAALASVATSQYPAEKIESLLSKDYKDLSQYEKKKLYAYKKALEAGKSGTAAQAAMAAASPKAKSLDDPETQKMFGSIAAANMGMQPDTVKKLASGEWKPDPKKPWQANAAAQAQEYLATGKTAQKYDSLTSALALSPPPVTKGAQNVMAKWEELDEFEVTAVAMYTGSAYRKMNNKLRTGAPLGDNAKTVEALDKAIAKSKATQDLVVVRGLTSDAVQAMGALKVGAVLSDKGFISTTTNAEIAQAFSGGGYGLKIRVPKGASILPVKHLSSHSHEDELVLPRGSSFKITEMDPMNRLIIVDLV